MKVWSDMVCCRSADASRTQCKTESTHNGKVEALPLPQRRVAPGLDVLELLGRLSDIQL